MPRVHRSLAALTAVLFVANLSSAGVISGELFYTKFSGAPNVKSVSFTYNDTLSSFVLGAPSVIGTTHGADGITGNPQNSDLLFVGGQGGRISTISKTTGTATAYASPASVFHLEVADSTTLFGSGIPGALARHTINPDGSLSAGTLISLSGADSLLTQVITTPFGSYYTSSGAGGIGSFGKIAFSGSSAVTTRLIAGLPAAHGGVWDPFTNSIIVSGDAHVTQIALDGSILSDAVFASSLNFDQMAVDGLGHAFIASNSGDLAFIDYTTAGLIGDASNFRSVQFLDANLDDIAPLIGVGGTSPNVPEPTSLLAWIGLVGLGLTRPRRRRRISAELPKTISQH